GRRRGRAEGHADEAEGPRETVPAARLPRPSDHPVRGLSRDHGPATGPPSGPRQTGDDARRPHRPRVRRGRGARVDTGPEPGAIDPRGRATLRRILPDRDGRGLAADPERMARDQGPSDDVRRAPRERAAAYPPGGPNDRRGRREGPAGPLRPRRLECRGGQPASLGGGGSCDLPRSPPRALGPGTRIRRTLADPSEPEREGRRRVWHVNQ